MFDINKLQGATRLTAAEMNAIHLGMGNHSDVSATAAGAPQRKKEAAGVTMQDKPHKTLAEIAAERASHEKKLLLSAKP